MNTYSAASLILAVLIGALLSYLLTAIHQRRQPARQSRTPPPPTSNRRVNPDVQRALDMRHMRTIQANGMITAPMDIDREVTENPHEPGTPERAVWFGGYAMAAAKVKEVVL